MKQRIITDLLLLPIVLLAVCIYLWLRSYVPGSWYCRSHDGRLLLFWASGLYAERADNAPSHSSQLTELLEEFTGNRFNEVNSRWLGFQFVISPRITSKVPHTYNLLAIPYQFIILVLAPFSIWSWRAYLQRRRRLRPGYCAKCGYDLRASKDRCPECGEPIPVSGIQSTAIPRSA